MKNKQNLTGKDLEELMDREIEWGKKYLKDQKAVDRLTGNKVKREIWLVYYWLKQLIHKKTPRISFICQIWCRGIGDLWISTDPDPEIKKIEFEKWTKEKKETKDIIGFILAVHVERRVTV